MRTLFLVLAVVSLAVVAPSASALPALNQILGLPSHIIWPDCTGGLLCNIWPMLCNSIGLSCVVE